MTLSIMELGALGEFFGAIAVVATLIYLAAQIRQNTKATRSAGSQAAMNAYSQVAMSVANDDELSQIYCEDLYPEVRRYASKEEVRLQMWITGTMYTIETNYQQWLSGTISDASWHGFRIGLVRSFASMGGFSRYWETRRDAHSMEFQTLVDDLQIEASRLKAGWLKEQTGV